jgi:hypothetical protein
MSLTPLVSPKSMGVHDDEVSARFAKEQANAAAAAAQL